MAKIGVYCEYALLIQQGSQQVLIDGGPSPQAISMELGRQMPFWDRTIELIILTHPDQDHLAGLIEVLKRYRVEKVLDSNLESGTPLYEEWQRLVAEKRIEKTPLAPDSRLHWARQRSRCSTHWGLC